jgi:hypothetical protein
MDYEVFPWGGEDCGGKHPIEASAFSRQGSRKAALRRQ